MNKVDAITNEISGIYKQYMIEMPESEERRPFYYFHNDKETVLKRLLDNYAEEVPTHEEEFNEIDVDLYGINVELKNQDTVREIKEELPFDINNYSKTLEYYVDTRCLDFFDTYLLYYLLIVHHNPEFASKSLAVAQLFEDVAQMIQESSEDSLHYMMTVEGLEKLFDTVVDYNADQDEVLRQKRQIANMYKDKPEFKDVDIDELIQNEALPPITQYEPSAQQITKVKKALTNLRAHGDLQFEDSFLDEIFVEGGYGNSTAVCDGSFAKLVRIIRLIELEHDIIISPVGVERRFYFSKVGNTKRTTGYSREANQIGKKEELDLACQKESYRTIRGLIQDVED